VAEPSFGRGTSRGARRCYIDASTAGVGDVPYRSRMDDPVAFDDTLDGSADEPPVGPGRGRRILTVAIVGALVVSLVFLAFISGRGVVTTPPERVPQATVGASLAPLAGLPQLAVVGADARLVTMDAMGGSVTPIGRPGIKFSFPAWSPDGTRIAVIGTTDQDSGIYIFPAESSPNTPSDPVVIYQSATSLPFYLYWSPDGRRVGFLTTDTGGIALRVAPADASAPATLVRTGSPLYWAWSGPDRLLVHGSGGADAFFGEIGVDGTAPEPVASATGDFRAPALSADAGFRGYSSLATATPDQVIVESADHTVRHGIGVYGSTALDFGPVGAELAFIAPSAAGPPLGLPVGPLRLIEAATGAVRTLLPDGVVAFFWSPDGSTIAALQLVSPGSDKVAGAGGIVLARSTSLSRRPDLLAAAPPGTALRLAFVTVETGTLISQRNVRLSDLFTQQVLPFFDQYALSHRIWSPDGVGVVVPIVSDDGAVHLTTVRADGTDTRIVTDGAMAFWRPVR
jgi:TolB protein